MYPLTESMYLMDEQLPFRDLSIATKPLLVVIESNRLFSHFSEAKLVATLPEKEKSKLTRLDNNSIRRRFVAARSVLRALLRALAGNYVPEKLFEASGAPLDVRCGDGCCLRFSLSHAKDTTIIAIAKEKRVGVDIEKIRPVKDMQRLVAYACSEDEHSWFTRLPAHLVPEAFFRLWTRKEAVVKYYHGTIAGDMNRFTVPLETDAGVFSIAPKLYGDTDELRLIDFELSENIFGSLCWNGAGTAIDIQEIDCRWLERRLDPE